MFKRFVLAATLLGVATASPVAPSSKGQHDVDIAKRATTFWYANMPHTGSYSGYAPDLGSDTTYPVYMAVAAGATADQIQTAINSGNDGTRNPLWLASQPRVSDLTPLTAENLCDSLIVIR